MARMSIDDMFLRDPRVAMLAVRCGWNKYEARGRLLEVYAVVYDRVDAGGDTILSTFEVDVAADFPSFAEHICFVGLADLLPEGVRIRGAKERTKYLATRESSGRKGGIKSGESRRRSPSNQAKVTFEKTEGPVNPSVPDSASASASAPVPDSDTASTKNEDMSTSSTSRSVRKRTEARVSDQERAVAAAVLERLSKASGVQYRAGRVHLELIANRLREGVTHGELRAVIAHCASKWQGNDEMADYLRPETLFGPKTIHKYLDKARTEYADQIAQVDCKPKLEVVK